MTSPAPNEGPQGPSEFKVDEQLEIQIMHNKRELREYGSSQGPSTSLNPTPVQRVEDIFQHEKHPQNQILIEFLQYKLDSASNTIDSYQCGQFKLR